MPAIPESTRRSITVRLPDHAETNWPQLATVRARYHGSVAYITAVLRDGEQIPLCRLRYGGSAHSFGFAIYSAASNRYDDALLRTGLPTGTPQEALDTACTVHLAGLEPLKPPTNFQGYPLKRQLVKRRDSVASCPRRSGLSSVAGTEQRARRWSCMTLTRAAVGEDTSAAPGCSGDAPACFGDDTGPPGPVALTSQARVDMEEAEKENREDLGEKMTESQSTGPVSSDLLDAIRKSQDMVVDATKRLVDTLQSVRASIPAPDLPKPEELVANVYNFTEQLLESQRKFAEGMLEATKPLRSAEEGPAAEKGGKT